MKATGRLRTSRSASVQGMVNIRRPDLIMSPCRTLSDYEQHLGYHKGNKNQQIWVSAGRYWKLGNLGKKTPLQINIGRTEGALLLQL